MPRFATQSFAAFAALAIMAGSYSAIATLPPSTALVAVATLA